MDTTLLDDDAAAAGVEDGLLMRALTPIGSFDERRLALTIAVEDARGHIYRLIRTNSLCEAVRIFESAKDTGFVVAPGRRDKAGTCHKILRLPDDATTPS